MNEENIIDLKRLYFIIKRNLPIIIVSGAIFVSAAAYYVKTTDPKYTAKTLVLFDRGITQIVSDLSTIQKNGYETSALDSEVEVIKSKKTADAVLERYKKTPYYKNAKNESTDELIENMGSNLRVGRVGETYVFSIFYTATDPQEAADVANMYAESYIDQQAQSSADTATRTLSWLQEKSEEIKTSLNEARQKVNDFRTNYNKNNKKNDNSAEIGLSELKSLTKEVEAYESLYNSYLEKLNDLSLQSTFPITQTRIITKATPPLEKSHPKSLIILGASLILGIGIGLIIALISDNFDKTLKRAGQIKSQLDLPFIGFFPKVKRTSKNDIMFSDQEGEELLVSLYKIGEKDQLTINSETIRTLKNRLSTNLKQKKTKIIGIISTHPDEGASIIASSLAFSIAQSSKSPTLLIDADLKTSSPIKIKNKKIKIDDLSSILADDMPLNEVTLKSKEKVSFLPSFEFNASKTLTYLDNKNLTKLLNACEATYEYVIIDLPPLISTSDVYGFADVIDSFVIVAEWGKTLPNSLNFYLNQNSIAKEKVLGVILNKANLRKLKTNFGYADNKRS